MYSRYAFTILAAALVQGYPQGEGLGYPPPPEQTLLTTKSGVLPVLPTPSAEFTGVAINEGAIIYKGQPNPTFTPVEGPATTQTGLPAATYMATLPPTNFDNGTGSTVTGDIMLSSSPDMPGVMVAVNFQGFPDPALYGPFGYHIHSLPVPADGNCTSTMGHLDPTNRGDYYPCIPGVPQNCQVGDLAGKFGNITAAGDFTANYADAFLSTDRASESFVGGKSIVIHTSNATRITCANIVMMNGNATSSGGANGTAPVNPTYSGPVQTGGAGAATYGGLAVAAGLVAWVL